jgi:hypothetical protein
VTVTDSEQPVIKGVPEEGVSVECDAIPEAPKPTVSDNCDKGVALNYTSAKADQTCTHSYTLVHSWSSADACGHLTTASFSVQVSQQFLRI